ncbi:dipeptidase 1-like [Ischnura elegans]|uniref:dipeptidase 1-like n=1 Tax=Ischnura elegans TaxID=197161 RepID=UPI001ED8682C|nr:dipeptidase 1-like [Ischnura elegans]
MQNACLAILLVLMVTALGIALGVPLALRGPSSEPSPSPPPAPAPPSPPDLLPPAPPPTAPSPFASPEDRLALVRRILSEVPLVDGHNDAAWNVRTFLRNQILNFDFATDLRKVEPWARSNWSQTDLPRMREGMVGAQLWSAFVPCRAQHMDAVQIALEQIDVIRRLVRIHSQHLQFVTTTSEVWEAHRMGKIASLLGIEGGHAIGNSLAILRSFHDLGVRLLTLTHACNTPWADCSSAGEVKAFGSLPEDHQPGLSEFGKVVVHEMNRLGIIVDLAHTSFSTMKEVLSVSQAPVVFSHTASHALCPSPRNLPDEILKLVAKNGGVVMISFYSHFLTCNETSTMDDVIAHINHVRSVAGVDHVGIGAGFDGIDLTPAGLEDVSRYPHLFARLINPTSTHPTTKPTSKTPSSSSAPHWDENDVKKLAGLNFLRVLTAVEEIKTRWREKSVLESEEALPEALLEGRAQCISSISMLPENGHRTNTSVPQVPDAQWALP